MCDHPNIIITENLLGKAVHRWKDGEYDWSDEDIFVQSHVAKCPDCDYSETFVHGEGDPPEWILRRIFDARRFSHGGPPIQ